MTDENSTSARHQALNQGAVATGEPVAESGTTAQRDIAAGRRVLELEADALGALGDSLGKAFGQVIDLLSGVSGRLVISGIGKSGHIARKIAATLSSTGMPALFVHPGEASHGDLGMIAMQDAVIALSNSGNTAELTNLILYTRRFAIPLIGITSGAGSQLHEQADLGLVLPPVGEACPLGLAPTSSTTMMLALGDAVAVALLERRGFSAEDFQVFHPGGALGKFLVRVAEIRHGADQLPLCGPDTPLSETILIMTQKAFGCVGVVDGTGSLIGVITDGDLRRHMSPELLSLESSKVMTPSPKTITDQALAVEALQIMNNRSITCLFVVEQSRPIGIVHLHDCLRAGIA